MALRSKYNSNSSGSVSYGTNVVLSIVELAAQEINGVAGLSGKKVILEAKDKLIDVSVFINVYTGTSCADVAYRVQENIKRSVETMSSYRVDVINVNIEDVISKQESLLIAPATL